jgi:hypothetical protein
MELITQWTTIICRSLHNIINSVLINDLRDIEDYIMTTPKCLIHIINEGAYMITRAKLDRWTNSKTADREEAKATHHELREELEDGSLKGVSEGLEFKTKLQGSYKNTTMVYGSGDVDILVIRNDTYLADFSEVESPKHEAPTQNPKRMFEEHREGVYRTLQVQYGQHAVEQKDKAIEVKTDKLPLGADVVPTLRYRRYWNRTPPDYTKGIVFWSRKEVRVENFPKWHRIQGTLKNNRTNGRYKSTIRLFKNLRNTLVDENKLIKDNASSYYIECLMSNIPDQIIDEPDLRERVEGILDQLESDSSAGFPDYTMQHGMEPLFGNSSTQWNTERGRDFVKKGRQLYETD